MYVSLSLALISLSLYGGGEDPKLPTPVHASARWGADYFPNVPLVTHEGRTVRFFDDLIEGKVVVVNFIYTSCPDACPLETAKLGEVCELLGERVGKDVFLYSISIDPERDTPEVLREYAERYQTPPGWLFLTGDAADIRLVREKLGMIRGDETELNQHTLNLLIGNQATGKWMKRSPMENAYFLSTQIGSWLSDWKQPPDPSLDYASAPKLRSITRGENLFRTRCSACHAIGPDDGLARQGPNLLGVTERRERDWLARWLKEPDAMLAEGDPIALELKRQWRDLPMPNMRLTTLDVESLLGYREEESAWHRSQAQEVWEEPEEEPASDEKPPCCQKEDELVLGGPAAAATPVREYRPEPRPVPAVLEAGAARSSPRPGHPAWAMALVLALTGALGLAFLGLSAGARSPEP
ncbi:MAG TPA: SCO family protein [Planctomycetota bacterium]